MKSKLMIALVSATLLLTYPLASYAWSGGRGGHYYRSAPRAVYSTHHHSGGDYVVPYLLGGLVLGGLLGAVLSQPTYSAPPPAPTPSYGYSEPSYSGEEPPGEWVSVPGRWVNGRWVPAHRVWMPVNPY